MRTQAESVRFRVKRTSPFGNVGLVIPYEIEEINVDGSMDIKTGVFNTTIPGIYIFDFDALSYHNCYNHPCLNIHLHKNNRMVEAAQTNEPSFRLGKSFITKMLIGDTIKLVLQHHFPSNNLQFTGTLLFED